MSSLSTPMNYLPVSLYGDSSLQNTSSKGRGVMVCISTSYYKIPGSNTGHRADYSEGIRYGPHSLPSNGYQGFFPWGKAAEA
jgi:hypothetical protein